MIKSIFSKILFVFFTFTSIIAFAQVPGNDACAGATPLTLGNPCVNGTTVGSADNISSTAGCQSGGNQNNHNDVWYSFVSTGTQFTATVTTSAPFAGNVEFILVSGACGTQTIVNSVCGPSPLSVNIPGLTSGTNYYFIVSKQGSGTDGPFTICNYATTTPTSSCTSNDDCFTAQTITLSAVGAGSICTTGCNNGAAAGLDFIGNNCEDMPNPTVWYSFTTGATAASININLTSATMTNPEYTIFSNTSGCLGPYTILNCLEGTAGSAVTNSLVVAGNTTYYIAVSDATADVGNFNLCIAQNADNSACNTNNNLVVSATSMGSPLAGPYQPGEVVSFCYTITDWQQINCNYLGAVVPVFGDCWAASSFNAQGMPVSITTPLNVNGIIQPCAPGPPCAWSACAGTPAGTWNWFPAGAAQYNVAGGSLPVGAAMGAGWYFLSSYNPATGACTGDPTDPDFTYGDGNFPACNTNTFDYTLCFNLTAGAAGNCGTGFTDCGVTFKTYADGEFGAWNSIGCTADISTVSSATFACCAPPNMTSSNTYTLCSGSTVSLPLTSDIAATYSWIAANNTNVTGESITAQTTNTLNNTLTNTTSSVQVVVYTITPTSTTSCLGVAQTVTVTVYPTPTTTASTTGTLTCSTTTVALNSTLAFVNYTWTAPGGGSVGSANTQSTSASGAAGIYTLVTQSAAGCAFSTTTSVTQNTTVPVPTASNSTTLTCSITTAALTGGPASGVAYQWSGAGFSGGTTSQNATATAAGIYTLLVTSTTNSCTATTTVAVTQNTTAPVPTASNSTTLSCTTTTAALTGGPASGVAYQWSGAGFSGGTTSQNATATAAGIYTLLVTSTTNSCTATATVAVTQNTAAPTTVASTTGTLTCSTTTVALNSTLAGMNYTWTAPAGGSVGTANTQSTTASGTAGTYTIRVVNPVNGCSFTTTTSVTQNTVVPTTVASTTGTLTCSTTTVALNSTLAGMNYTWTAPAGGSVGTANTQSTTASGTAGTYTIRVVNPVNGCSFTTTTSVTQNTVVPTTVASTTGTLTCTTLTVNLNSTLAGMNYTWTAPAGGSVASANTQSTSASGAAGIYSLTVVNSSNGCSFSTTTSVTQNTVAPTGVSAGTNQTLTCASASVTLTGSVLTPTNATVNWTGASVCGTATTLVTSACGAGVYTLTATNPANGCTASSTVQVFPSAGAPTVTNNPVTNTITCTNTLVTVSISTTVTPVTILWTGTGITSGNGTGTITVNQGGTFQYTVTNTLSGCSTSNNQMVIQNTTVPTTTASTSGSLTCSPSSTVGLSSTLSGMNYTWTAPSGGSVATANTQTTSASGAAGVYTLNVVNPANGCSFTTTTAVTQNTAVPTTTASTSGSLTCSSSSTVGLSSTLSGMNYTWTAPSGGSVGNANSQNTSATGAAGVYTLNVIDPATGCTYSTTTSVSQNTTVPTTTASTTGTITCTTSTVSLSASLAGMNYTWTAPSGGSVASANSQNTSATGTGNYTLTVMDPSNNCTFTTTSSVTDNTVTPTGVSAGSNQTLTCTSGSVTLNGSVSTPTNALLDWGTSVCGSQTTATTTACAAGVYTLTATDPSNGCSATSTVEVFPNAGAPTPSITSTALTIDCNNTTQSATVTSTPNTDIIFNWNNTPFSASSDSSIATFNNAGTYICTVTNTISGCSTPIQVVVSSNTTVPTISITGTQTLTCSSPSVTISLTTTPTSGLTYTWTGGAIVSGQGTDAVVVNQLGVYSVTITDGSNGCVNTATTQVDADANVPAASITASSSNSLITCQNPSVTLTASVTPSATYSYTWLPSGGNASSANITSAGTYTVLVLNATTGCSTTAFSTVTSNTTAPTITTSDAVIPCGSPSVALAASSSATNSSFGWTTSTPGTILSGSNTATPLVGTVGQYVVTTTDADNGCSSTATVNVTTTGVNAAFTANPTSGAAPLLVNFTNQSTGATTYAWTFGDTNNNTSSLTDPNHTYNTIGNYTVVLVATDASGLCSSTATISIEVLENSTIVIPNVFTPNGDGFNDLFKIKTTGIKDLNCDIFNRWGQKMYTIKGVNDAWDGSGAPDGTYFFILNCSGFDGKEFKEQGYITLFN